MAETVGAIESATDEGRFVQHVVVNAAKLVNMRRDPTLREAVGNCDIINADGASVVLASRLLGRPVPERVTGIDLFEQLLGLAEQRDWKVYLLGAKPEVIERCAQQVEAHFPRLRYAYHHGYFWEDEEAQVARVRSSGAAFLFVGITSPLKETFINRWASELGVSLAMGVGGTFDVWAGDVPRAPLWMQRSGMEWAWRLYQEPRRMARRTISVNSRFALLLGRAVLARSKP